MNGKFPRCVLGNVP